jgi:hypothetical protein
MKKVVFCLVSVVLVVGLFSSCQKQNYPFSYVGTQNGQTIYLDGAKGKVVYVDESNRIIDYVSLRPDSNDITNIVYNKTRAIENKDWGERSIPGKEYSLSLSTRFYNNRLLYQIKITPFNDKARQFARTVTVELNDKNGFNLGEIDSTYSWTQTVDSEGNPMGLNTQGSIPITLRNYLEIEYWGPKWSD